MEISKEAEREPTDKPDTMNSKDNASDRAKAIDSKEAFTSNEIERSDDTPRNLTPQDLAQLTDALEAIVEDRALLLPLEQEALQRLLSAAGKVAHPGRAAKRRLVKASRKQRREQALARRTLDEELLAQTEIRRQSSPAKQHPGLATSIETAGGLPSFRREQTGLESKKPARTGAPPEPMSEVELRQLHRTETPENLDSDRFLGELENSRNCYICKSDYRVLHRFYDSMCPECAEFNWQKRNQAADLSGRHALLTGGRVKIGFEAALKLLRAGAHVVVTTRFPHDATTRYQQQPDSAQWWSRLQLVGLDMRHTPSVESFANYLSKTLPRLDFILNNACQTVRRPPGFYKHLMAEEHRLASDLPRERQQVLEMQTNLLDTQPSDGSQSRAMRHWRPESPDALRGIQQAAVLSQLEILDEDRIQEAFPAGHYDQDAQQIDTREKNSWRLKLDEVATVELLEVHLVNAVAPYILNARLRPLMKRQPTNDKHIVNVSAMEGVFYRAFKRDTHPHTNMAKAALNMMTRTSAVDYIRDGIHMNSVDTGWITDEDPLEITHRKQREHGFSPPLDLVDAAARICDPIFHGILTGEHHWGKFLKDYRVSNW